MTDAAVPQVATLPSPTTLAYLFADRFCLAEKAGRTGQRAWGTGAVVVTKELAAMLPAVALWQLRATGAVTLEQYQGKKLGFIAVHGVRATLVGDAPARGGVDAMVLDYLRRSRKARDKGETAWDIVNILAIGGGKNPWGVFIGSAIDDAVNGGYLHREKSEVGVVGRLAGKPTSTLVPHPERIAPLDEAASDLARRWAEFRKGADEALAKELRSSVYDGIEARDRSNNDSD